MVIAALLALLSLATHAPAQDTVGARAPIERATSRHILLGDLAVDLRSPRRGVLTLALADARQAVSLEVRSTDARRWSDSALRILSAPRPAARRRTARGGQKRGAAAAVDTPSLARRMRVVLEEPGVGAGSLLLTRTDSAGATAWALYGADGDLAEVRQSLDASEARVLAGIIRRAAIASAPPPLRRSTKGARRPRPAAAPKAKKGTP